MSGPEVIETVTYTTEASVSAGQSQDEVLVPDPEKERALAAIEANTLESNDEFVDG